MLPLLPTSRSRIEIVAIGASTGGPNALAEVFAALPADLPVPIVVVQHMPPMFTQLLAERLDRSSKVPTVEARTGMVLTPGKATIAPGDFHLTVEMLQGRAVARVQQDPHENGCRPAVDPLLRSIARTYGPGCLAVVMTGMGHDGLKGCEAIRNAGGQTVVQDEATSVVWGMPGSVARAGLADRVVPLASIASEIVARTKANRA
ncbi:MAG TPA: CheB methylesterase domain-containing protein [Pirellulaceae bacterium]|nr:CheB methylesterase domain-containing protein [Pirellulaceae bacterium]